MEPRRRRGVGPPVGPNAFSARSTLEAEQTRLTKVSLNLTDALF